MTEIERLWVAFEPNLRESARDARTFSITAAAWHAGATAMLEAVQARVHAGDGRIDVAALQAEADYLATMLQTVERQGPIQ